LGELPVCQLGAAPRGKKHVFFIPWQLPSDGPLRIGWSLIVLLVLSIPEAVEASAAAAAAAARLPVLSEPIGTWSALAAAMSKVAGTTATLTLSPSFTMEGYHGYIRVDASETSFTIEGHGAVFDAAGNGTFFALVTEDYEPVSLTVRNVTMKNGYFEGYGGAVATTGGTGPYYPFLTLDGCTLVNNTCTDYPGVGSGGGALYFGSGTGLIKGCSFVGQISNHHNDICNYNGNANVTFACADGEVGTPVQMQGNETTVIPPKELQCTAGKYLCQNGGTANWQCVPTQTGGVSYKDCNEVCSP
jgi:hypothetical protein